MYYRITQKQNQASLLQPVRPPKFNSLPREKNSRRLIGVSLFLLVLFSLLIVQFFRIQIVQHDKWEKEAYAQHTIVVKEPFKRGVFYSNTSVKTGHPTQPQPLVIDVPKYHLFIDPQSIPEKERSTILRNLNQFLHLNSEELYNAKNQFEKIASRSRKVAVWIPSDLKDQIQGWWNGFSKKKRIARNAIYFIKDYQRSYPYGKLLGQVLHTVREQKEEGTENSIPTGGLEYVFNDVLQGKSGKRLFYRSPRHSMDVGQVVLTPQDGSDVYLTINHYLQSIAEEEIEKQVKKAEAKRGWAILMDPYSGEVLALAQYPFFAPAHYKDYFNDPKKLEETQVKAVNDPFEPGSTMKAITMAVCLMANEELKKKGKKPLFDPQDKVLTLPTTFPGRTKILKDVRTHQFMNMNMAIQKSSNVYMAKMLQKALQELGDKWYRDILENVFGFSKKTGIELPGESSGLLPTPGRLHPNGKLEWSGPTPYSLAMGHNILANSFQMLRTYAIIANGGYDVKPTLIHQIGNRSFIKREPKRLLDENVVSPLLNAMNYVTKTGGAAPKANIPGYSSAGKTSTSEKIINGVYSKKDHISTFIGFAPTKNPAFVLMVVIDEPAFKYIPGVGGNQFGGNCAAPAFKNIGLRTLQFLGVQPDDPDGKKWAAEVTELKKLYDSWNKK